MLEAYFNFMLIFFSVDVNECDFNPCENNGTCVNNNGSYTCNCTDGWKNRNCIEGYKNWKITSSYEFLNRVTLTNAIVIFKYICFIDSFTDINECDVHFPCQNNGTCVNNNGSYYCDCKGGWQGHDCEIGKFLFFV